MAREQQSALQYDPTNPTPYAPPSMPDPTPAMPSPLPTDTPQANGAVKQSGAIATIADGILRGFMQGRSMAQAKHVMQLKKKTDDLQSSYNQDAVRLYQLTNAGYGDPSASPEQKAQYAAAKSAVDGSWGALMDFYGSHIEQQKKGKGKKAEASIKDMLTGGDPMQVSQAWYQIARQAGPPVYGQIAMASTKEAQTGRQAQSMAAQNAVQAQEVQQRHIQAQKDYDELVGKDPAQMTDTDKQRLANAKGILFPPRQTGAAYLYQRTLPNGEKEQQRFREDEVPEGEGWQAVGGATGGAKKLYKSPDGRPNAQGRTEEYYAPGEAPQGWQVETSGGPKIGTFGFALKDKYGDHPTYEQYLAARRDEARARHVAGAGRGSGTGADKTYEKWMQYYKDHYPNMSEEERDTLARRKTEGASQMQAGGIGFDAATEPQQFDSDVINQAIDNLRKMPQYGGTNPTIKYFDDALSNIVGLGDDGYVYHNRSQLGQPSNGKYAGDVTEDQLKGLERDLQTQIRIILSKQTGLPPEQKRSAAQRMAPLFGPAAQFGPESAVPRSGNAPAHSPQAAASTPAPPSSAAPSGGPVPAPAAHKAPSKGTVKKSAFLKANPGATDADWKAIQPQLQQEGYDTKDE